MKHWKVGVCRRTISPPWGVELAGMGYYLNRTWEYVRDDLTATAFVAEDHAESGCAIIALDLMANDTKFTERIRQGIAQNTGLPADAICVNCSHSHNAPTAGFYRGAGEPDEAYLEFAVRQAVTSATLAWRGRRPARLRTGYVPLDELTFNRTRDGIAGGSRMSFFCAEELDARPLAILVNFHAHPTLYAEILPCAVSRDCPGAIVDLIERALPGVTALYLQGACGDTEFRRATQAANRCSAPARTIAGAVLQALPTSREIGYTGIQGARATVLLPTRPWTPNEVQTARDEALYRSQTGDTTGWLQGMASTAVVQPENLPQRYGGSVQAAVEALCRFFLEWAEEASLTLDSDRPVNAELQALRIGDFRVAATPAELFSSLAYDLRQAMPGEDIFVLGYSNGWIGYLPDPYEIERGGYAALQSPKATGQHPFTADAGAAAVHGLTDLLACLAKNECGAPS